MVGKFPAAKINFHSTIVIKLNPVEVRIRGIVPDFVDNNGIGQNIGLISRCYTNSGTDIERAGCATERARHIVASGRCHPSTRQDTVRDCLLAKRVGFYTVSSARGSQIPSYINVSICRNERRDICRLESVLLFTCAGPSVLTCHQPFG